VIKSNKNRSSLLLKRVYEILKGQIKNKRICFLGVTFKANTDDMRDSSSLSMIPSLIKKGALINYFDPTGEKNDFTKLKNIKFSKDINSAIINADLIIIHTEWNDFKSINFKKVVQNKKFKIFDMRNIYSATKMKEKKIKYFAIGR
jgi:UDPglucose 6-dehydrogenase